MNQAKRAATVHDNPPVLRLLLTSFSTYQNLGLRGWGLDLQAAPGTFVVCLHITRNTPSKMGEQPSKSLPACLQVDHDVELVGWGEENRPPFWQVCCSKRRVCLTHPTAF